MKSSSQKNCVVVFDAQARLWRLLRAPCRVISTARPEEVVACVQEVEAEVSIRGVIAAGFVAYEAAPAFDAALRVQGDSLGFPLVWFALYEQWSEYAFENCECNGISPDWQADIDEAEYQRCISQVQCYINAGDTYQVNYSYRRRAEFSGEGWALFCQLASQHQPEFGAYLHIGDWEVLSLSPELFFTRKGKLITSIPMKGTMARGLSSLDDEAQGKRLQACCKNRAENVMIVDMVRNDLGRIAVPGSVRVDELFALRRYPTLWQMVSSVSGEADASLAEIFAALFPAASITGAPKARTMELIAELESTPRRLYTGSIGFLLPDGRAQFSVAIRTMLYDRLRQRLEYGVGGGIVADSSAVGEWHETQVKTLVCHRHDPEFSLLETMRWTPEEGIFLFEYHLQRLEASARYFNYPYQATTVRKLLMQAVVDWNKGSCKLRLLISRQGQVQIEAAPLELQPTARAGAACAGPGGDRLGQSFPVSQNDPTGSVCPGPCLRP